jgi:pimeloyl-ACP methyl ester carboxylesterase
MIPERLDSRWKLVSRIAGMPPASHIAVASDDVSLFVESTGKGAPILFIHEFAGDHRSWEPQVRAFARSYRCITYAARGYPPSDVPTQVSSYSLRHAVDDALAVLDALEVGAAHLVGLSMGGFCALHVAVEHPQRAMSVTIGGVGYGAQPEKREAFREECEAIAHAFETKGSVAVAERYALGPARVQFLNKDPRGHAEFARMLSEHSATGAAGTMRGFQKERPSLYDMRDRLAEMTVPLLIMVGDEDEGSIEPSIMLKRTIPSAGLVLFPQTGHTLNLEEPDMYNRVLADFLAAVASEGWSLRDPRSLQTSTTGMI